ncbi:MAG: polysaccharide ABC transporter ATP-binding protein [Thermoanaerobaculum sp.]|nr:polysaccharide ABC transporter ATP-binding protein [Thermoanaerobaculum sp.]
MFARRRDRLKAFLGYARSLQGHPALDSVSFTAYPGEAVGVIGENGSGKSTLLRIVAGISPPDRGTVAVAQPVAGILELGLGFHGDFTGRENAILYGSLLGLPAHLLQQQLERVLAFAELGPWIDQPLRTYSSGMAARLAFSVATQMEPAVLVVDEALAVGDEAFQRKCIARMQELKERGKTVLFCSHAMYQVVGFCNRALWLHQGRVKAFGPAAEVVTAYQQFLQGKSVAESSGQIQARQREQRPRVLEARISPGQLTGRSEDLQVRVRVARPKAGLPLHLAVEFREPTGLTVAACSTLWDGLAPLVGDEEEEVRLIVLRPPFARGPLEVLVHLADEHGLRVLDTLVVEPPLVVASKGWQPGFVALDHQWALGS